MNPIVVLTLATLGVLALGLVVTIAALCLGHGRRRGRVAEAYDSLNLQMKRRRDLIPHVVRFGEEIAPEERAVLDGLVEARTLLVQKGEGMGTAARFGLELEVGAGLGKLMALVREGREASADEHFLHVRDTLEEVEGRIAAARLDYNSAVSTYNSGCRSFPGSLVARRFGFEAADEFEDDAQGSVSPRRTGGE